MKDIDPGFAEYVRGRQDHLLRIAVLMCGDVHEAQDLLQDALVILAKHWHKVRDGHPDAYTRRILYTQNVSRWRKRRLEVVSDDPPESGGVVLTDTWVDYQDVRDALKQVPPKARAVLILRYFEDQTESATAQTLGVSVGTVKSQAHSALAKMREILGSDWGTREPGDSVTPGGLNESEGRTHG